MCSITTYLLWSIDCEIFRFIKRKLTRWEERTCLRETSLVLIIPTGVCYLKTLQEILSLLSWSLSDMSGNMLSPCAIFNLCTEDWKVYTMNEKKINNGPLDKEMSQVPVIYLVFKVKSRDQLMQSVSLWIKERVKSLHGISGIQSKV